MSNKRAYYCGKSGQDVIDVIYDFDLGWLEGDILKRLVRMGKKDGQTEVDDWRKIVEEAVRGLEQAQSRSIPIVVEKERVPISILSKEDGSEDEFGVGKRLPEAHFGYAPKRGHNHD